MEELIQQVCIFVSFFNYFYGILTFYWRGQRSQVEKNMKGASISQRICGHRGSTCLSVTLHWQFDGVHLLATTLDLYQCTFDPT